MIRRINLYGGASTGKSTSAAEVFASLKRRFPMSKFELVQEFVKIWAYEKKIPKGYDQNYIFAKQLRREEIPLRNGVDLIVTDSPLFLGYCYAFKYAPKLAQPILTIINEFEKEYPSHHVFIERGDKQYNPHGRYEDEEAAKQMDIFILNQVSNYYKDYKIVKFQEIDNNPSLIWSPAFEKH